MLLQDCALSVHNGVTFTEFCFSILTVSGVGSLSNTMLSLKAIQWCHLNVCTQFLPVRHYILTHPLLAKFQRQYCIRLKLLKAVLYLMQI